MKLKVKLWKWSAGVPVAMLNKKTAEKIGTHTQDRISIKTFSKHPKEISTIIDTIGIYVGENEIAISSEIKELLNLNEGQMVDVNHAETPNSLEYIKEKLNKKELNKKKIKEIIQDIVNNSLSEAEIAIFVSAIYNHGMSFMETVYLIESIMGAGNKINLGNHKIIVDKHCIGGIPGNRTTPIVVSICSSIGLTFPKTSSRAITSAAGTADVIETIAKVDFTANELRQIVRKTNASLAFGGSLEIVPADSKIIKIEKELKIDPPAMLLASIMSKKLAAGSKIILIDIPYGKNAKVSRLKAYMLKKKFEKLGKYFKRRLKVVLTDGNQPIGNGIGPALEMKDVISVLKQENNRPLDLEKKSIFLAGELLEMSGKTKKGKGIELAKNILKSKKALRKFKQIIKAQHGNLERLKESKFKFKKDIFAKKNIKIKYINNNDIAMLARVAGCPVDKFSGVYLYKHLGEKIKKREKIITIYAESESRLKEAIKFYNKQKPIKF